MTKHAFLEILDETAMLPATIGAIEVFAGVFFQQVDVLAIGLFTEALAVGAHAAIMKRISVLEIQDSKNK